MDNLKQVGKRPAMSVLGPLRNLYLSMQALDGETDVLVQFIIESKLTCGGRILDVGCGYGRLLEALQSRGISATGVDVNATIVRDNVRRGLRCLSAPEFDATEGGYDIIVMSHVIEHFAPESLLSFMQHYLDRLEIGGRLIIATPLMSKHFYDDFDHIKPYQPSGLLMVFGDGTAQIQYAARQALRLRDIWFRKAPYRLAFSRARYVRSGWRYAVAVVDMICALAFLVTARLVGKTDGWVGVFERTR